MTDIALVVEALEEIHVTLWVIMIGVYLIVGILFVK